RSSGAGLSHTAAHRSHMTCPGGRAGLLGTARWRRSERCDRAPRFLRAMLWSLWCGIGGQRRLSGSICWKLRSFGCSHRRNTELSLVLHHTRLYRGPAPEVPTSYSERTVTMASPQYDVAALRDFSRDLLAAAGAGDADAEHGAVTVLEAGSTYGQVAMQQAVEIAGSAAATHGMAGVAVQGSTHFGAGRFWMEQLAEQGLAGILTSTTGPVAAPFGGSRPILGTNPLSIALPSAGPSPLIVDLATTAGAYGKVVAAHQEGQTIPADWAVDATGEGTIDPGAVLDGGALLPFGGHKGSGVAVLIEGLSAALSSAAFAFRTVDIWQDPSSQMNTGHLLLALDIAAFGDPDQVRRKVEELQQEVRA